MHLFKTICGSLLVLGVTVLSAFGGADVNFAGYVKNVTSLSEAHDGTIASIGLVQCEGNWNHGDYGGIEVTAILSAELQPLSPFETIRKGSVMDRALNGLIDPLLAATSEYLTALDTLVPATDGEMSILSDPTVERLVRHLSYSSYFPNDKAVLDRALVKIFTGPCDLFIGRQTIAWGTGYAFNPTDVWNVKNPLDPDAQKPGVNALRIEVPFGAVSGLSLVVSPGRDFSHSSGGARLKVNVGRFDLSLSGMKIMNADRELLGLPKKIMAGTDMAGQLGEIGVWTEIAVNNPVYAGMAYTDFDSAFVQADLGADYTFENGLYSMIEYYYNGLGRSDKSHYHASDLINMLAGESAGFARHYLFCGITYTLANRFNCSAFVLGNLTDVSAMLLPAVSYEPIDDITIEASFQIGVGDRKNDEYGGMYPTALLTVTGYF